MKTIATVGLLALLTSCTALNIDGARAGVRAQRVTATDRGEINGQSVSSSATGSVAGTKLELVNRVGRTTEVGLVFGYGRGAIEQVDIETFDVGMAAREFFGTGTVRPYFEGRIGYQRFGVRDDFLGHGGTDTATAGIGLGVELGSVFVQVDFDGAIGKDFDNHGPGLMVGGVVRF